MGELLLAVLLLAGNAFFVGGEFALIASRRTVVEPLAATSRRARAALSAMNQIPLMIAGAQLGITICSLGLGAIAEPALAHLLEGPFAAMALSATAVHVVSLLLALAVVVYLHTVVGEMVPKNLTLAGPESAVLWLGAPMLWFCLATKPLLVAMKWSAKSILRIWGIEAADAVKTVYTAEELANLVTQARTEGLLDAEEHARIRGALALQSRTAGRDATLAGGDHGDGGHLAGLARGIGHRTGRSRFPVVRTDTRQVIGFVHVKDVLGITGRPGGSHRA
jgi:CBS domain containing-hemolysin-like protein